MRLNYWLYLYVCWIKRGVCGGYMWILLYILYFYMLVWLWIILIRINKLYIFKIIDFKLFNEIVLESLMVMVNFILYWFCEKEEFYIKI